MDPPKLTRKDEHIWRESRKRVELAMAYNFLRGDRDQPFLLPPDLRDWLPAGHLAWFILDVVDQLDLAPFYRPYRDDGHGHPAYDASHAPARLPRSATRHARVLDRAGRSIRRHLHLLRGRCPLGAAGRHPHRGPSRDRYELRQST